MPADRLAAFLEPAGDRGHPGIELAFATLPGPFGRRLDDACVDSGRGPLDARRDVHHRFRLLLHVRVLGRAIATSSTARRAETACEQPATPPRSGGEQKGAAMSETVTTKPSVLVVWPNRPRAMAELDAAYRLVHLWQASSPEELIDSEGPEIRAIVSTGERGVSAALIDRLPRLEIVACFGVGYDGIDVEACRGRGIRVTNTPDVLSRDVADMGLGLILMTLRRMAEADRFVRRGAWLKGAHPLGTCLAGKKLGIVGLGRIGLELARRAEVVGMLPGYHNRQRRSDVDLPYFATAADLARWADVLVLACPGGAATRHLVDAAVLEVLGPDGWLINIARGSVVDEAALIAALEQGRIRGAGLDVFADEPRVPDALLAMENVVLQPHNASATEETRDAMAALVVANLAAHFAGRELVTPVA